MASAIHICEMCICAIHGLNSISESSSDVCIPGRPKESELVPCLW